MPFYLSIGVSKKEFMESTPVDLQPYNRAFEMQQRRADEERYMNYIYTLNAISCGVGLNKNAKPYEQPLLQEHFETLHMSQEEKDMREIRKMLAQEDAWMNGLKNKGYEEL